MYCLRNNDGYYYVSGKNFVIWDVCALVIPRSNVYWGERIGATAEKVFEYVLKYGLEAFRADTLHDRLLTFTTLESATIKAEKLGAQVQECSCPQIYTTADKEFTDLW
jgi:hypothetical protein